MQRFLIRRVQGDSVGGDTLLFDAGGVLPGAIPKKGNDNPKFATNE
jgi:hypothetical protein